jgi:hypothetical protein
MKDQYTIRVPKRWAKGALIALVTALVVAPVTAIASHSFTDVPDTNTFHADIEWLKDAGVTKGCNPPSNTQFCPDDPVTRGQMAAFMHRLADNQVVDADKVDGKDASDFLGKTQKAADADKLDGKDASDLETFVASSQSDWIEGSAPSVAPTGSEVLQTTVTAPASGFILVTYTASMEIAGGNGEWATTWVTLDSADCGFDDSFLVPDDHLVGTIAYEQVGDVGDETTLAGSTVVAVAAGSHTLRLCGSTTGSSSFVFSAALSGIFLPEGTTTILTSASETASGGPSE